LKTDPAALNAVSEAIRSVPGVARFIALKIWRIGRRQRVRFELQKPQAIFLGAAEIS